MKTISKMFETKYTPPALDFRNQRQYIREASKRLTVLNKNVIITFYRLLEEYYALSVDYNQESIDNDTIFDELFNLLIDIDLYNKDSKGLQITYRRFAHTVINLDLPLLTKDWLTIFNILIKYGLNNSYLSSNNKVNGLLRFYQNEVNRRKKYTSTKEFSRIVVYDKTIKDTNTFVFLSDVELYLRMPKGTLVNKVIPGQYEYDNYLVFNYVEKEEPILKNLLTQYGYNNDNF